MPKLSLEKLFAAILGVILLLHLKEILGLLTPIYEWFCHAFDTFYDFPRGMQAAIAVAWIALFIVLALRIFKR